MSTDRGIYLPHDGFPLGFNTELGHPPMDYRALQRMVGGLIEATYPDIGGDEHQLTVWLNEESRILSQSPNRWASSLVHESYGYPMLGDGVLLSTDELGESVGLDEREFEWISGRLDRAAPSWYQAQGVAPVSDTLTFSFTWQEVHMMTMEKRAIEEQT